MSAERGRPESAPTLYLLSDDNQDRHRTQSMDKPRIFISHSAKEPDSATFLSELSGALNKEINGERQFEVLLDRDGLELGDYWRSTLNLWIGGCDAAIVLLSESALASSFVAYEASILAYRKKVSPDFRLLPVLIKPVRHQDVAESPLKPSCITEIQDVKVIDEDSAGAAIRAILAGLTGLGRGRTPAERHAAELANILRKVERDNKDVLLIEADHLDIELGTWVPDQDPAMKLALKLIGAGLPKASRTIRNLRGRLDLDPVRQRKTVQLMVDLVASSWVDDKAAMTLPEVARAGKRQCVAVNAGKQLIAKMYVNVAGLLDSNLLPSDSWLIPGVSAVLGEVKNTRKAPPKLIASIEKALKDSLVVRKSQNLKDVLKIQTAREPVFFALPTEPGFPLEWLDDLQEHFPGVTFFLLFGDHELKKLYVNKGKIVVLEPLLEKGCEKIFCTTYQNEYDYLMQGLLE